MNKKAKRRAFFICLAICIMNLSLITKLTDIFSMKRISREAVLNNEVNESNVMFQKKQIKGEEEETNRDGVKESVANKDEKRTILKNGEHEIEPEFFITLPILAHMIKNRVIEEDVLILSSNNTWKKPLQILRDNDREGLKNLSHAISKEAIVKFLNKEGIKYNRGLTAEELFIGSGYVMEKDKLIEVYEKNLDEKWDELFPFVVNNSAIVKTDKGFRITDVKKLAISEKKELKRETEWIMPDVRSLSIRKAIETLNKNTATIKIYGCGIVMDQYPVANEVIKGDTECILYGKVCN